MTKIDSTTSPPFAPPHYQLLAHPLIHNPASCSYSDCQDILENAVSLLALFHNLEFEENSNRGPLSSDASGAFYCLITMLQSTLRYVAENLDDAWRKRETAQVHKQLQQSVFFKSLQVADGTSKEQFDKALESCLGISRSDIDAFIRLLESGPDDGKPSKDNTKTEPEHA